MRNRALSGIVQGVFLVAVGMSMSGCVGLSACSTVGYLYSGPAVLEFAEPVPSTASVAACFGEDCAPAELAHTDGQRWEVPQEAPYLGTGVIGMGEDRNLRVVVTGTGGAVLSDKTHEIPITMEHSGVFGQCPGPFTFDPVGINIAN